MRHHARIVCIANEFSQELERHLVVTAPCARHLSLLEIASDNLELILYFTLLSFYIHILFYSTLF
jgi:hypothetical protein